MAETPPDKPAETYEPRREARVLHWDELSAEQRGAAKQAHDLVRAFIAIKSSRGEPVRGARRFLPHIDSDRRNQNILLDGGRGSGKTALLLTLLDLWTSIFDPSAALRPESPSQSEVWEADRKKKCLEWDIDKAAWPVVPLGIVDLQVLPTHTPMPRNLVEPLVRVIEALEDQGERSDAPPPWLHTDTSGLPSRKRWNDLLRAIVADWDDASQNRWGKLDVEEYVHEADRAVRDHQNLVACFRAFIDALIEDFKKGRWLSAGATPLFVLAIDDVDMHGDSSGQLLEALRLLHHPRVVFISAGDSELFYRRAEEDAARMLRSPRGRASEPDGSPVRDSLAVRLGHAVYDKVIPRAHRCEIPPIPASERHRYVPKLLGLSVKSREDSTQVLPIRDLLKEPTFCEGLPDRLRALQDIDLSATPRKGESQRAALVRAVLHIWRRAVEDAPAPTDLYPLAHQSSRVRVVRDASGRESLSVSPLAPSPSAQVEGPWLSEAAPRKVGAHHMTVQLREPLALRGMVKSDEELADGLLGALMLANQTAFELGSDADVSVLSNAKGLQSPLAQALYTRSDHEDPLPFGWPLFDGYTLLDLALVNFRWRRALPAHTPLAASGVVTAAQWFLTLVAQLAPDVQRAFPPLHLAPAEESAALSWQDVARRVLTVARWNGTPTDKGLKLREWARGRALLLAAPESGLPVDQAEEMLSAFEKEADGRLWDMLRERTRAHRDDRILFAMERNGGKIEGNVQDIRRSIDEQAQEHPWKRYIVTGRAKIPEGSGTPPGAPAIPSPASPSSAPRVPRVIAVVPPPSPISAARGEFLKVVAQLGLFDKEQAEKLSAILDALNDSYAPVLAAIVGKLEPLLGVQDAQADAFARVWNPLVDHEGLRNLLSPFAPVRGSLTLEPVPGRFRTPSTALVLGETPPHKTLLEFRDAATYILRAADGRDLPPLLDFLYKVVWDRLGDDSSTPFLTPWCEIVSARLSVADVRVLWPFFPWYKFNHYDGFSAAWREVLQLATGLRENPPEGLEQVLFLYALHAAQGSPRERVEHRADIALRRGSDSNFANLIWRTAGFYSDTRQRAVRCAVNTRWLRGLALLVAPESGIAEEYRQQLSVALRTSDRSKNTGPRIWLHREDVEPLRVLRVERMKTSIETTNPKLTRTPEEVLADVDRESPPTHWDELLGELYKIDPPTDAP